MSNVLVFIEQRDGKIRKASLEALTLGRTLAGKTGGTLAACVAGSGISGLAPELAAYGAAKVFVADAPELAVYSCEGYTAALDAAVAAFNPGILLVSATVMGKDVGPRLAARRKAGVLSDVMSLDVAGGRLVGDAAGLLRQGERDGDAGRRSGRSRSPCRARTSSRPRRPTPRARARSFRSPWRA